MGIVSGIVASSGGTDVSDATAKAYDIKTGKTAYIATGSATGTGYFPGMVTLNGTTGYYSKSSLTTSGNKVTAVVRFAGSTFTGAGTATIMRVLGGASNRQRVLISAFSSDHATVEMRSTMRFIVVNSAGAVICRLTTNAGYLDGEPHTIFAAFDGDAGAATFKIDGIDGDQLAAADRVAPTAGTLETSASSGLCEIGSNTGVSLFAGSLGFCGHREAYLTNWADFMQTDGAPKDIDETTWAEWSGGSVTSPLGRPLFWHESGKMDENKGSAGAMTANGTIILAAASTWS